MTTKEDEMRAKLVAGFAKLVQDTLDDETSSGTTLADIESAVMTVSNRVREAVLQTLTREITEQEVYEVITCPDCGETMESRGTRHKRLVSEVGELEIERKYYYCPSCKVGHFPPG